MNWLLLRGLIRERRHWSVFPSVMQERLPGHKTFPLDLPGFGTEHRRSSPTNITAIAEDVRERWLQIKAQNPGPWSLMCISLGGMVGLSWVARHDNDFQRVVLINSSAGNLNPFYERMKWRAIPRVLRIAITRDLYQKELRVLKLTSTRTDRLPERAQESAAYGADAPVKTLTSASQLFAATTFRSPPTIPIPLLVLTSDADGMVSSECSRTIAFKYNGALRVHSGAGHDLPLDDGPWVADQVRDWIATQSS